MIARLALFLSLSAAAFAQLAPSMYEGLRWRCIGPFRAGRTVGAVGVRSQPNVFYIGVNNGGVWRTTDYGRTWAPIFDDQPTGSVGDIAISQSNPNTIYVGSGEGLQRPDLSTGDGIYKTTDGGKTWQHLGLRDAQQIGGIIVDPTNPDRVFVAALGHPYGPNEERGIYRSLDGGKTWQRVLYKDKDTGAIQVEFDPQNPQILYADLWQARQGPWENGQWQGPGSGLYKSTDGGTTWRPLTKGLPTFEQGLGRIGFGISNSNPSILYATVEANPQSAGIYRSDDAGESWRRVSGDARTWGRGSDFAEIRPHPKNPETVYVANTASYISTDGGKTWRALKGAPGGDDYHRIWINPDNPQVMLFASDQGATITVNAGETWSSWYNQPTAQFYHVITDNQWPYWVYSGQQESGSAGVASRGDYGAVTWRDWQTVGAEEYGYVAPDPLNPNIIYGGKLTRFDKRTGQAQNIAPEAVRSGKYRFLRTAPVIFSPVDKKTLYYAGNVLFKTLTGGQSWQVISPDLTREKYDIPESVGVYRTPDMATMPRRGVIYTVAPSFQNISTIWVGTDDGLIQVTRDGGNTWSNVTPPDLTSWSKVSIMEASHFDNQSAYAAINRFRLDDLRPHIYRTHDGGKTWKRIVNGIPADEVVNVVREDPVRKGLLYAGTERAVYFSIDDGENWSPLRRNMPATSIRDLVIHQDDVVVGTHGRSFWILDDITPLRQMNAETSAASVTLFKPQTAIRVRRSVNTDTPIPPEEPMGENPPDGAILYYRLANDASQVTLEILDAQGKLVRRYSSTDQPEKIDENQLAYPSYWFRPQRVLSAKAGMHRWTWNLHYSAPEGFPKSYPMTAIYRDTPPEPDGPTALPGQYTVKLTVDGKTFTQPLTLKMDPRVTTPPIGLKRMFDTSFGAYQGIQSAREAQRQIQSVRTQLRSAKEKNTALAQSIDALDSKLAAIAGQGGGRRFGRGGGGAQDPTLASVAGDLLSIMSLAEGADVAPSTQLTTAAGEVQTKLKALLAKWESAQTTEIADLNRQFLQAGLPALAPAK
jgi:photosystem II stability/assembly factor-like uncharacterized protein